MAVGRAFANPSRLRKLPKLSDGAVNTHPIDVGKGGGRFAGDSG